MLQQIIADMYVPPDILDNLKEEDKQLIFLLIRKEQIKRYKEWDNSIESEAEFKHKPNKNGKNVGFVSEEYLVSFLGEREGDLPIEKILAKEAEEKALKDAEELLKNNFTLDISNSSIEPQEDVNIAKDNKSDKEEKKHDKGAEIEIKPENKPTPTPAPKPATKPKPKVRSEKTTEQKRNEMVKRKSQEIYCDILQTQKSIQEQAEKENKELQPEYEKCEEKSRLYEHELSLKAQLAREKIASIQRTIEISISKDEVDNIDLNNKTSPKKEAPKLPTRPSPSYLEKIKNNMRSSLKKFESKSELKKWFLEEEWKNRRIFDGSTDHIPLWFHGAISREQSNELLKDKEPGTFLVRLSERYPVYVLSYVSNKPTITPDGDENRIKNIVIEVTPNHYQFLGPASTKYTSLINMINTLQTKPVNSLENEILIKPQGQEFLNNKPADYMDLLYPEADILDDIEV